MIRHLSTTAILCVASLMSASIEAATPVTDTLRIVYTTDVHGCYFPTDYITRQPAQGSLSRVSAAVNDMRSAMGADHVVLLDNGDILQGQPTAYYYNFIDTVSTHVVADIYDYMGYDAVTIGNHDVETGHAVYDRVARTTSVPILGANVLDRATGKPYLKPYQTIERAGLKIAVLGLLTPAIPAWLPENLWSGLEFEDMRSAARKWMQIIRQEENPDLVIGLFHSGADSTKRTAGYLENASMVVAKEVPGFDLVLMGHDHREFVGEIKNVDGKTVRLLNPANNARNVGVANIVFSTSPSGPRILEVNADLQDVRTIEPDTAFLNRFAAQQRAVDQFVSRRIGMVSDSLFTRDAYFGPSAFMTLLHDLQLQISGADISFAAPLSFDGVIPAGPLHIADMFTLYKYENMLYTMELTGLEIKNYLEEAYSLWTRQITPANSHIINFESDSPTMADNRLRNPSYNFDSAAGIIYTVDITKPIGQKINILSMADGTPFDFDRRYKVAVNSYRGNGGGDLLTKGAGIAPDKLKERIVAATDKDLRYYLIKEIERQADIHPRVDTNWRFIPEAIAAPAIQADRRLLFSPESAKSQK